MHKNIILRQNKFISSRTALAFFCSKTFWNLGISDGFPEEISADPFPFAQSGGILFSQACMSAALAGKGALRPLAKAMGMAYNRGRESSLAPMEKKRGMSNAG